MKTESVKVLSKGFALGKLYIEQESCKDKEDSILIEPLKEKAFLLEALDKTISKLEKIVQKAEKDLGADKAAIFEGHIDILSDPDLRLEFESHIDEGRSAYCAVTTVMEKNAKEFEALEDVYFQERAFDMRDLAKNLKQTMCQIDSGFEQEDGHVIPLEPSIIFADELSPSQTLQYNLTNVLGFVVSNGGTNSHAAILARSLGIPAVVLDATKKEELKTVEILAINTDENCIIIEPSLDVKEQIEKKIVFELHKKNKLKKLLFEPSISQCGKKIGLYANIGNIKDLGNLPESNPDGIGLFRTEFLFMEESTFPSEEKQTQYYIQAIRSNDGKPIIFRLLDIGGDKPLAFDPIPFEKNPFLGIRGARYLLRRQDILRTQVRAILAASSTTKQIVHIMVPMISQVSELKAIKQIVYEEEIYTKGKAKLGMMVEVPAVAMNIPAYKGIAEFISIGSNDLTQYALAVDREHTELVSLYNEFHPGVLSLISKACQDAQKNDIETGICGELASKPEAAPLLLAMGFDELSMRSSAILQIKEIVRSCVYKDAQTLLFDVLNQADAQGAFSLAVDFLREREIFT